MVSAVQRWMNLADERLKGTSIRCIVSPANDDIFELDPIIDAAARAELGRRKLGKQLEAAARDRAHFAVIVGDELADGQVQVRDLEAGTQKLVGVDDLAREIGRAHDAHHHGVAGQA
jgi:hypothetical protein